ncbi:type II secretion system F family protein [Variovorax paradoxus]|uniref:type II secretion system F family protein n=1 Tax=Variovorax paradoxus TaxID=34073 RepID=UPI000785000B|nr:type II secretion system F family protein [Variovorax paradoxus]
MTFTPAQLAIWSLVLLALGLFAAAAGLLVTELQRVQRGKAIGRAIQRDDVLAPKELDPGAEAEGVVDSARRADADLPLHWLNTRVGRALVANEDRRLIDQCGFSSMRAQLVFLVTRVLLAILLPLVAVMFWPSPISTQKLTIILTTAIGIGFMVPKFVLGRIAAGRRERVAHELPLFIDLLRLLQGVGLSLDQSLQIMASDFSHVMPVLGHELAIANSQYSRGRTREHSLNRLGTLHANDNLAGMVSLLVQVDRHGGAVQEPLRIFSDRLREHRKSEMKERIGKITVKMTAVMVGTLLPALVIVTAGPGFIAIFRSLSAMSK